MTEGELNRRVEEIGDAAIDLGLGAKGQAYIEQVCGNDEVLKARVMQYVRAGEGTSIIDRPVIPAIPDARHVQRVGPWTLLKPLGEGGLGVVYLAERSDGQVRQLGAIKFLKGTVRSRDLELRFLDERQILANLSHPYIVKLMDTGVTPERQPYLVMEFVEDAQPIDVFCLERRLPVKECLSLFRKVCEAVGYAHQKLVVHRDLKPENILVSKDGTPHLLDFGVAKIMDPIHRSGMGRARSTNVLIGTERYFSPEQARREPVDTATDIYSLGVILYELLTGTDPYGLESRLRQSIAEIVCNVDPETPSKAVLRSSSGSDIAEAPHSPVSMRRQKQLKGDLDAIVLMALRKERQRRYPTAGAFSNDIQRHLENIPVHARPDSFGYRASRFFRRNRAQMLAAALVIVSLGAGLVMTTIERNRAVRNEHVATARELALYASDSLLANPQRSLILAKDAVETTLHVGEPVVPAAASALQEALLSRSVLTLNNVGSGGIAFSPDGKRLAIGGSGGVQVRDTITGRELFTVVYYPLRLRWQPRDGNITSIAFSPDGSRFAASNSDGTAKVWDAATGGERLTLSTGSFLRPVPLTFSPDGRRLATSNKDDTVTLWDTTTGRELATLRWHPNLSSREAITSVAFSPDGARLATSHENGTVRLWDMTTGRELLTWRGHEETVTAVAFSPDGRRLATSSEDGTVKLWDASIGKEQFTVRAHLSAVRSVAFSSDGRLLATASNDNTAKVWTLDSPSAIVFGPVQFLTLVGHQNRVTKVVFSPDGKLLATTGEDHSVRLWDVRLDRNLFVLPPAHSVYPLAQHISVSFSRAGKRIATLSDSRLANRRVDLFRSNRNRTVAVWDAATHRELFWLDEQNDSIACIALTSDGSRLAASSKDGTTRVWEVATSRELVTLRGHKDEVTNVTFSPDGTRLATSSDDHTAKVWDAMAGRELFTLRGHKAKVNGVAFSPDGQQLATASSDGTAKVWNTATGRELFTLRVHNSIVTAVAFSPDRKRIVTLSYPGTVKVWNATGQELLTLPGYEDAVTLIAFSPDGNQLATADSEGVAKLWDILNGDEVFGFYDTSIAGIAFSPDGKRLSVASDDGAVKEYTVNPAELLKLARARIRSRSLTLSPEECQKYLHTATCPALP